MKRILLLVSACIALGAAGCCCCQGQYACCGQNDCGQYQNPYDEGCPQVAESQHHHHHLFNKRSNRDCAEGKCKVKGKGKRCRKGGNCPYCGGDCYEGGSAQGDYGNDVQLGDAGCGCDCGGVMQTGCSSACDGGCGGCANGNCGAMGGAPTGGCASGNCGSGVPTPVPANPTTSSNSNSYDPELQALQAAGWTIMPTPGTSTTGTTPTSTSSFTPTPSSSFAAPPVPTAHISEPVAAPPASSGNTFVAPVRSTGAR